MFLIFRKFQVWIVPSKFFNFFRFQSCVLITLFLKKECSWLVKHISRSPIYETYDLRSTIYVGLRSTRPCSLDFKKAWLGLDSNFPANTKPCDNVVISLQRRTTNTQCCCDVDYTTSKLQHCSNVVSTLEKKV